MSDEPTTRDPLPADAPDLSNTQFTLEKLLGQGGFGAAYQVFNRGLRRRCVLKLLTNNNPTVVARFYREAQVMANLEHPGIPRVQEVNTLPTGAPYFIMDFVDGVPLGDHLATQGPLPVADACEICAAAADALAAAHEQGVIHRDIKLPNILLSRKGQVKVIDFGIAHQRVEDYSQGPKIKTMVGQLLGTPRYMAPEQVLGLALSPASDFYSLGVVLVLLPTGRSPFDGTAQAMMMGHVNAAPPSLAELGEHPFPPALEALVARLLAKEPKDRPGNGVILARELRAIAAGATTAAPASRAFYDEPTATPQPLEPHTAPVAPALPLDPSTISTAPPEKKFAATELVVGAARLVAIAAEPSMAYSALDLQNLPPQQLSTQVATRDGYVPVAPYVAPRPVALEPTPSAVQTFVQPPSPRSSRGPLIAAVLGVVAAAIIAVVVIVGGGRGERAPAASEGASKKEASKKPVEEEEAKPAPKPTVSTPPSISAPSSEVSAPAKPPAPVVAAPPKPTAPAAKPTAPAAKPAATPAKGAADDPF